MTKYSRLPSLHRAWRIAALLLLVAIALRYFLSAESGLVTKRDGLSFASGALDAALDSKQPALGTRILGDFVGPGRARCRIFARAELSGIACQEFGGWHLRVQRNGVDVADNDGAGAKAIDRALRVDARELADQK